MRGEDPLNKPNVDYRGTLSVSFFGHGSGIERDHLGPFLAHSPSSSEDDLFAILGRWASIWLENPEKKEGLLSISLSNKLHHPKVLPSVSPKSLLLQSRSMSADVICGGRSNPGP